MLNQKTAKFAVFFGSNINRKSNSRICQSLLPMGIEADDVITLMFNIAPIDDLNLAMFIFHQCSTTLYPVAA